MQSSFVFLQLAQVALIQYLVYLDLGAFLVIEHPEYSL